MTVSTVSVLIARSGWLDGWVEPVEEVGQGGGDQDAIVMWLLTLIITGIGRA